MLCLKLCRILNKIVKESFKHSISIYRVSQKTRKVSIVKI